MWIKIDKEYINLDQCWSIKEIEVNGRAGYELSHGVLTTTVLSWKTDDPKFQDTPSKKVCNLIADFLKGRCLNY